MFFDLFASFQLIIRKQRKETQARPEALTRQTPQLHLSGTTLAQQPFPARRMRGDLQGWVCDCCWQPGRNRCPRNGASPARVNAFPRPGNASHD